METTSNFKHLHAAQSGKYCPSLTHEVFTFKDGASLEDDFLSIVCVAPLSYAPMIQRQHWLLYCTRDVTNQDHLMKWATQGKKITSSTFNAGDLLDVTFLATRTLVHLVWQKIWELDICCVASPINPWFGKISRQACSPINQSMFILFINHIWFSKKRRLFQKPHYNI